MDGASAQDLRSSLLHELPGGGRRNARDDASDAGRAHGRPLWRGSLSRDVARQLRRSSGRNQPRELHYGYARRA
jgi:hypothetical protein